MFHTLSTRLWPWAADSRGWRLMPPTPNYVEATPNFWLKIMQNGPRNDQKWSQNGPKRSPNEHLGGIDEHLGPQTGLWLTKLAPKLDPGWPREPPGVQKGAQKGAKRVQKGSQNGSKMIQKTFQKLVWFRYPFLINFGSFSAPELSGVGDKTGSKKQK